ncbi:50S ribosomal protein L29 [archaeon]|nr:50S ribosomal protein L29 [archaeon]|tara:strand:+ start:4277 stop:4507 length:231 start_codon:yes stop_codon:yes gene_type:complete
MSILKKNELKQASEASLKNKLEELKKELMRLNAQVSTGTPPENPGKIKLIKKTIAKILTKLNEKEKIESKEVDSKV